MEIRTFLLEEIQQLATQLNESSLEKLLKYAQKLKELEQRQKS